MRCVTQWTTYQHPSSQTFPYWNRVQSCRSFTGHVTLNSQLLNLPKRLYVLESLRLHCCVCSSSLISRRLQLIKKNQRTCEAFCYKTSATIGLTFFLTCFSGNKYSAGYSVKSFLYFTFN